MSLLAVLQNLSVFKKIAFGTGLILVFLATVSAVSYFSLSNADLNFNNYRSIARESNQFGRIQANLLSARLAAKDYIQKNTEEAAEVVSRRVLRTSELIDEAGQMISNPERKSVVDGATSQIDEYYAAFGQVRDLVLQRNELVDTLNSTGTELRKNLTSIMESAYRDGDAAASYVAGMGLQHFLLARIYASKFLVDNEEKAAARAFKEMDAFTKMQTRLDRELQNPTRRNLASSVGTSFKAYRETFQKVQSVITNRNSIIFNTMDVIGPKVADEIETAKLANKNIQDELGPRATAEIHNANVTTQIVSGIAIILGITLALLTARAIATPIVKMTAAMGRLAEGDLDAEVPAKDRKDEVGKMAAAVQTFKEIGIAKREADQEEEVRNQQSENERREREEAKAAQAKQVEFVVKSMAGGLNKFAEGDLTVHLNEQFSAEFDSLRVDFNQAISKINETLSEIKAGSSLIDDKSKEIRASAESLSKRTESQAASLEETSAALEEITSTVSETSTSARDARGVAERAMSDTNESSQVVSKAVAAMQRIEAASQEISKIINVIDEIAFQTNLLALNAGVEAARAGEAGSGFAVVAQEVRELAQRSADAAKEINDLITKSNVEVSGGVDLVKETGEALEKISKHVSQMNTEMSAISVASDEQLVGVKEVNVAVSDMDQLTQQNAAMAEESTAVTFELATEVESLSEKIGRFKLEQGMSMSSDVERAA